ncbi:MAG TPA: cytochrome B [Bacteroides sp.]|nr:cytochrome B [Bacteroides sp.]
MATKKIYLYPVWVRLWHMINALMILLLILTGISMRYSTPENPLIRFDIAVGIHNVAAFIVTFNYGIFVIGNILTRNGRYYRKWRKNLATNLWKQFVFYAVGIFRKEPHPFPINEEQKFNPLQKFSYVIVMYLCMPLLILSGLGLMFPDLIAYKVFNISGLVFYDVVHIILGFVISLFVLIHIYTCTLGDKPGTLFKSMINGYHEEHE